jgi:hypothetical protein
MKWRYRADTDTDTYGTNCNSLIIMQQSAGGAPGYFNGLKSLLHLPEPT